MLCSLGSRGVHFSEADRGSCFNQRLEGGTCNKQARAVHLTERTLPSLWPAGGDGASFRGTMHREGCQCIICKNARRSGRTWAGMQRSTSALSLDAGGASSADTVPDAPGTTVVAAGKGCASSGKAGDQARPQQQQQQAEEQQGQQLEQSRGGSEQRMDDEEGGPRVRDGKRAYLRALPQLATAGATPLEVRRGAASGCATWQGCPMQASSMLPCMLSFPFCRLQASGHYWARCLRSAVLLVVLSSCFSTCLPSSTCRCSCTACPSLGAGPPRTGRHTGCARRRGRRPTRRGMAARCGPPTCHPWWRAAGWPLWTAWRHGCDAQRNPGGWEAQECGRAVQSRCAVRVAALSWPPVWAGCRSAPHRCTRQACCQPPVYQRRQPLPKSCRPIVLPALLPCTLSLCCRSALGRVWPRAAPPR